MTSDGPGASSIDQDEARRLLEAERERLNALRGDVEYAGGESETESVEELSSVDQHPADLGTETQYREQDLAILESLSDELSDVESALVKLEEGTYGICEACGRPIGAERLQALPATRFCIDDATLASAEAAPGTDPLALTGQAQPQQPSVDHGERAI